MNLMFITLASFDTDPGHLMRLSTELNDLSELNVISILCLGKEPDSEQTKNQYKNISFYHLPIEFNGWAVVNLNNIIKDILKYIEIVKPDIVILQMEIWDLMRELSSFLWGKVKFITVLHAMPFLGTPMCPSGDFEKDVIAYLNSGIEKYRKDYIEDHYKEIIGVLKRVNIIASNKTVAYYLSTYFEDIKFHTFNDPISIKSYKRDANTIETKYDFAYMARMEKGKGAEYLEEILKQISLILKRTITVAILGRPDDIISSRAIDKLLAESNKNKYFKAIYFGWANKRMKEFVLSKTGVFLYPSHYDTYAIVLSEALSFGLPSIVWDMPFIDINYSSTKAVIRVKYLDFRQFAESAVKALQDKDILTHNALDFINSLAPVSKLIESDLIIYKNIINCSKWLK